MAENKKILLQILMLFSLLPLLCSCVDKIEYKYEDVVITRYDRFSRSEFFCNKSDKKCKIVVTGAQCYYNAWLCVDRETKKVWIVDYDASARQQEVDTVHFQEEDIDKILKKEFNINNYINWSFDRKRKKFEEKFECYALKGLGDYVDYEENDSKEEFPNSKIEARYKLYRGFWGSLFHLH